MSRPRITYLALHATPPARARWARVHCPRGWHLFREERVPPRLPAFAGSHHLLCDACGLVVKVAEVVVPAEGQAHNAG